MMTDAHQPKEREENNNNAGENKGEGESEVAGAAGADGEKSNSSHNSAILSEKCSLKKDQPGNSTEEGKSSNHQDEPYYSRSVMTASIRSSSVKLLTPQMIEDDMKSKMSGGLLSNYKTPPFNIEEEEDDLSLYEVSHYINICCYNNFHCLLRTLWTVSSTIRKVTRLEVFSVI